MEVVGQL